MKAFTLIELLVVVAIIAIVAALLFPAFKSAEKGARKTSAINNMHQCVLALGLYQEENGRYPVLEVARQIVPRQVTYDPSDFWRPSEKEDWPVMLGSFGYPYENPERIDLLVGMSDIQSVPLLASIFYEEPRLHPFKGDAPPDDATAKGWNVRMPDRTLVARGDGSAKVEPVPHLIETLGSHQGFTWGSMFFALARRNR